MIDGDMMEMEMDGIVVGILVNEPPLYNVYEIFLKKSLLKSPIRSPLAQDL
jgi:hypothetical protein